MIQPLLNVSGGKNLSVTGSVRFGGCNLTETLYGAIVIYKFTLNISTTQEECVPNIKKTYGLQVKEHFSLNYFSKCIKSVHMHNSGITFKENCPDVRNTKVVDVIHQLQSYGTQVTIYDPWANPEEVMNEYGLTTTQQLGDSEPVKGPKTKFDAIVLTAAHNEFLNRNIKEQGD